MQLLVTHEIFQQPKKIGAEFLKETAGEKQLGIKDRCMTEMHDPFLPTRESLLVRLKSWDDHESWSQFFNAYWRLIYGAALRSGLSDAQAQDVVQDTVIAVAKKMKDFRYESGVDSFKGWLLYLTRKRIALEYRRKERDRLALPKDSGEGWIAEAQDLPDPAGFDLESLWEQEWEKNLWEAALSRLKKEVNAKQFQMFDLYVLKERSADEVAKQMGVAIAQVYLAKHRISTMLKAELARLRSELA
jgi:RNA polymerase sigma factor (sigma-70 family)